MSRLWPDTLQAGLFPEHCWLAKGKGKRGGKRDMLGSVTALTQTADVLSGLDQCLMQAEGKRRGSARLSLVVSDSIATIAPLPWQDGLSSEAELQGYARICFDKLGVDIGPNWILHVEYLRYGATGLAYALPRDWMDSLLAKLEERQIQLRSVLPISAAIFGDGPDTAKSGLTVVLLFEATQHCALIYQDGTLVARDVEPFAQSIEKTCHRLLARTLASRKSESKDSLALLWWAYREIEFPKEVIQAHAADAKVSQIAEGAWP